MYGNTLQGKLARWRTCAHVLMIYLQSPYLVQTFFTVIIILGVFQPMTFVVKLK